MQNQETKKLANPSFQYTNRAHYEVRANLAWQNLNTGKVEQEREREKSRSRDETRGTVYTRNQLEPHFELTTINARTSAKVALEIFRPRASFQVRARAFVKLARTRTWSRWKTKWERTKWKLAGKTRNCERIRGRGKRNLSWQKFGVETYAGLWTFSLHSRKFSK